MRIHEKDGAPAERQKISGCRIECGIGIGWSRWEGIVLKWSDRVGPRRAVIGRAGRSERRAGASRRGLQAREVDEGFAVIRGGSVKLQVVLALEDIIEDADAAANAGLAGASGAPGKS